MLTKFSVKQLFFVVFSVVWLSALIIAPITLVEMSNYVLFSLVGVLGAIFANTTGAGGGVVFIPMFNQLNFTEAQSVATSFGIQCFGMTAGAITWWHHYCTEKVELKRWQGFKRIIVTTSIASIIGLWFIYVNGTQAPSSLHHSFSWFSLVLGLFIVGTVFFVNRQKERSTISAFDWLMLAIIGFFGGALTAWLSVGVGELLAVYLIIRRFDISMAVAAAVLVSALTVWSAIWQHTLIDFQVYWQVILFAGPGAVLGGIVAKTIVIHLSASRLKLFFAFWLVVIGLSGI